MQRDSVAHTFKIATLLCLVCSFLVSGAAVGLRTKIETNKELEKRKNILKAAGLWEDGSDVDTLFQSVEKKIIDLNTGKYVDDQTIDPKLYDQKQASKRPETSSPIPGEKDIAGVNRREQYSFVYLVKDSDNSIDQVVLPIRGYGLWSTLYGFLALDAKALAKGNDEKIIRGLAYYEHAETPGLGAEVDNEKWKALWKGKRAFDKDWGVVIEVVKPPLGTPDQQVDALSGATITSQGVTNMLQYWLGDEGFGPYLKILQAELSGQQAEGGPGA